jgi:glycolate dehydrogenase FAD-binding subunit
VSSTTALGLGHSRTVDPVRYALGGLTPRHAVRPADRDEVAEALRAAASDRLAVVPWGAGVSLAREQAPARYDLALDLCGLDRIVEYDPEDFTVTAECGVTVARMRAILTARGQELPIESCEAARATLGGVLAADASGPRRLHFGAPHDRILGARFALADGALVTSGGKVVKNVAGYGTHRLLCGSRGGLAVIVEASLKLAPAPAGRVALCYEMDAGGIADAARWRWLPRMEPAFASVVSATAALALPVPARVQSGFAVIVGLEDDRPWVAELEAAVTRALGTPRARVEGEEVASFAQALADLEEQDGARLSFTTAGNTPAALAPLLAGTASDRLAFHAPAGRLHLFTAAEEAQALVEAAASCGFVLRATRGLPDLRPPLPPQSGVLALRARIRAALDPGGSLALGARWAAGAY